MRTPLNDGVAGVVLNVEQVLHILDHLGPPGIELQAGEVTSHLKVLTPLGLLLDPYWEQPDQCVGRVSEASLAQGGECKCDQSTQAWRVSMGYHRQAGLVCLKI
jgi:hypothetical protein